MSSSSDVIDLREIAAALRRGRRWILAGGAAGLLLAGLVSLLLETRYQGEATVLLRPSEGAGRLGLAQFGDIGGLAGVISGSGGSGFDTEIQILTSRTVLEDVVDSLALQVRVERPENTPARRLVAAVRVPSNFTTEEVEARRVESGYRLQGTSGSVVATPGLSARLPSGLELTLREGALPDVFELRVVDRAMAVERLRENLGVDEPGGDIARLIFKAPDRYTAAAVPNVIVARYLVRRKGEDRGVNQRRYVFLREKTDSIARQLAQAEASLRTFQETSGVIDPELSGRLDVERAMELETELETLDVEARTLRQILNESARGRLPVRSLAAYPTFLRNPAINSLLVQLLTTETERTQLLQRRTELDPEVVELTQTVDMLEQQLVALSTAYLDGVERQSAQLGAEVGRHRAILDRLPGSVEESYRRQRDVRLLSEMLSALQGQQLQAHLGAVSEGGDVRVVDEAVAPREPSWPNVPLNLALGLIGGLVVGLAGALGSGFFGEKVRDHFEAELAGGVPALALRRGTPLFLAGGEEAASVLVIPVGDGAQAGMVAQRFAGTAALQGRRVALARWDDRPSAEASSAPLEDVAGLPSIREDQAILSDHPVLVASRSGTGPAEIRDMLSELEQRFTLVVASLPPLESPVTTALLSPPRAAVLTLRAGGARRSQVREAAELLRRLGVTPIGIVLADERSPV